MLKIPRKIERRTAQPGMDLYDYVVALNETEILVLQRVGDVVVSETIVYRDVRHLSVTEELLRGNVHLAASGRSCDLPYKPSPGR